MRRRTKAAAAAITAAVALAGGVGVVAAGGTDDDVPLRGDALERAVAAARAHVGGGEVLEAEVGDDGAAYSVELRRPDGARVEVELDAGYAVVGEAPDDDDGDDDDALGDLAAAPLVGDELDRAVEAARAAAGGGDLLAAERGDDGAAYTIELLLEDGRRVEVDLGADLAPLEVEDED